MTGVPAAHRRPAGLVAAVGLLLGLTGIAASQAAGPAAADPNAIRVLLAPAVETTLVAEMTGRIVQLDASLGAAVAQGRTVVAFDCGEPEARALMAEAELASAQQTLDTKRRLRVLEAAGDMEVALAVAAQDRARGAVALARAQVGQCTVVAPFGGRVAKVHVKPHQGVGVGTPLVDLVSAGPLKLRLNVPSLFLRQLRVGTPFSVAIDETGKTYPARVSAINARVDAVAQTVEIEARLAGSGAGLLAGMSGVARFPAISTP
jgi:RND family efflux transporter MFP subunit